MTRKDYDTEHLISLLKGLKARYPHLEIILEPGSALLGRPDLWSLLLSI